MNPSTECFSCTLPSASALSSHHSRRRGTNGRSVSCLNQRRAPSPAKIAKRQARVRLLGTTASDRRIRTRRARTRASAASSAKRQNRAWSESTPSLTRHSQLPAHESRATSTTTEGRSAVEAGAADHAQKTSTRPVRGGQSEGDKSKNLEHRRSARRHEFLHHFLAFFLRTASFSGPGARWDDLLLLKRKLTDGFFRTKLL